ncbi:trimeric intracellular cation channel family protein [Corynebacterium sanguinis]|nr:trimeric intracellular cation channel family protein [Corynebacterium sanguinis]TVS26090.1 trimeric intracellular cation channel family protein [Corynebacterium sanguinis]TVS30440.1 trimeric intracellular cation channel family protein [Corynebacterium sanguinis]
MLGVSMPELLTTLFVIGIIAESMTAAVAAGRVRMDLFGVITLGALTALGGGTVRDVILGNYPLTWVDEPRFLLVTVIASVVTVRINWLMYQLRKFFLVADAVGLAAFVVLGIQIALSLGHGFIIAAVAAVTTGVSGGVMRDILSGRVPLVFREELYASIAVLGTVVYMGLMAAGVPEWIVTIVAVIFVFVTRLLSLRFRWSLPIFDYDEERAAQIDPKDELASFVRTRGRKIPGARRVYRKVRMVAEQAPVRHKRKGNSKG